MTVHSNVNFYIFFSVVCESEFLIETCLALRNFYCIKYMNQQHASMPYTIFHRMEYIFQSLIFNEKCKIDFPFN